MAHLILKMSNASDPPVSCQLVFKKSDQHVYTAGEKIEGTLIVSHQKDLILHGFKVVLEGTAFTKYREGETVQNKTDTFLSNYQYVFGKEAMLTKQKFRLAGGTTPKKYPFGLQFPDENLPASFKSQFGMVHYQIVTYMHMPNERFVKKAEKVVNVQSLFVLPNTTLHPIAYEKSEKIMSVRRPDRQFKFRMLLPQSGYLPGEEIPFEFEMDNPNEYEISNIIVTLLQRTKYKAGNWSRILKTTSTEIVSIEKNVMDTNYGTMWGDAVKIPAKQTPTIQKGLIEIQYVLKVEVNAKQVASLRREIPILIGTSRSCDTEEGGANRERNTASTSRQTRPYFEESETDGLTFGGINSCVGRPPSYSSLSLRTMTRTGSSETLPPDYEDVTTEEEDVDSGQINPLTPEACSSSNDLELLSLSDD